MKPNAAQIIGLFITLFCGASFIWLGFTALSWPLVAFSVLMMLAVLSVICFPSIPLKIAEAFVNVGLDSIGWARDAMAGRKPRWQLFAAAVVLIVLASLAFWLHWFSLGDR